MKKMISSPHYCSMETAGRWWFLPSGGNVQNCRISHLKCKFDNFLRFQRNEGVIL